MRYLVISYEYPPNISARAFRWGGIVNAFAAKGIEVDVVTSTSAHDRSTDEHANVTVYEAGGRLTNRVRSNVAQQETGSSTSDQEPTMRNRIEARLSDLAVTVHRTTWKRIYWPDYACLWFPVGVRLGWRLLKRNDYDAMFTVSPPYTGHLVGYALQLVGPELSWVVDIGDPFCFETATPPNNRSLYATVNVGTETRVFERASAVAVTNEQTRKRYITALGGYSDAISVVPPIATAPANTAMDDRIFPNDDVIRLVYTGTFYDDIRSPDFFLGLFDQIRETHPGRIELHVFGDIDSCRESFEAFSDQLGTTIHCHGAIQHAVAARALLDGDILVNVGNTTTYQLPSKVIEYAQTGKPILNVVKRANDSTISFFQKHQYPSLLTVEEQDQIASKQVSRVVKFISEHSTASPDRPVWLDNLTPTAVADEYATLAESE